MVCDGVGVGAGGVGGGLGLAELEVGFGFGWALGALLVEPRDAGELGAAVCLRECLLRLADALGLGPGGLGLGLADGFEGLAFAASDAVAVEAAWLNRFMNPTTPTALSSDARQVSVDSLRSPLSRCAPRRSRCLMGCYETGKRVKRPPRMVQGSHVLYPAGLGSGSWRWWSLRISRRVD